MPKVKKAEPTLVAVNFYYRVTQADGKPRYIATRAWDAALLRRSLVLAYTSANKGKEEEEIETIQFITEEEYNRCREKKQKLRSVRS